MALPLAHVGHWLWALYLPPILIVLGSIARTSSRNGEETRRLEDLGEAALQRRGDLVAHGALGQPFDQRLEEAFDDQ